MKVTKILSFAIASVVFFSSCNNDDIDGGKPGISGDAAYVSVKISDSASGRSGATVEGTADESKIVNLEFFVFNSNGQRDIVTIDGTTTDYSYYEYAAGSDYSFGVSEGSGKTLLVAANMSLGRMESLTSIEEVKKVLYSKVKDGNTIVAIENPLTVPAYGIPMAGDQGFNATEGQTTTVNVSVNRLFARFDAPFTKANGADVSLSAVDTDTITKWFGGTLAGPLQFELKKYYVVNGISKSFAFPNYGVGEQDDRWDPTVWTLGNTENGSHNYITSTYNGQGQLVSAYTGSSFLSLNQNVYLYENSPLRVIGNIKGYDAHTVYAMIIEGVITDGVESVTRYWRINVNRSNHTTENVYKILRNAVYKAQINEIKTLGYGTPGEAEEEKPVIPDVDEAAIEVFVEVADWRLFEEGVII